MPEIEKPAFLDYSTFLPNAVASGPVFTMPDGRTSATTIQRADVNAGSAAGRGGMHFFRNGEAPLSNRLRWMESKEMFPGVGGPSFPLGYAKSPQEWENRATQEPLYGIEIDEFMEGEWNLETENERYTRFKAKRKQMYADAGIQNPRLFLNYGAFCCAQARNWQRDGITLKPTHDYFLNTLQSQQAARNRMSTYFAVHFGTSWPNVKYYPEGPGTSGEFYMRLYEMTLSMLALGDGGQCAYVTSDLIESLPGTVSRPEGATHGLIRQARRVANPPGKVTVTGGHADWDLDQHLASFFIIGLVVGTCNIFWKVGRYGTNPNTIYGPPHPDEVQISNWSPDQPGTPPPWGDPGFPQLRCTSEDKMAEANFYYWKCSRTAGQKWKYLRFRINDGAWIEPRQDAADVLFRGELKQGICLGRTLGNAADYCYYNPSLPKWRKEKVTVEIGGRQFSSIVWGGRLKVFNEDL
ncbi:hypothetical protein DYU11_18540 [Fibrisoma montanum]|uniref:Uncharacterized protein n=1 Tax=Fibrisoma montanum TaxID=2305895 RepID=A0A418M6M2_9BACT|nr:hypothetical protein [Fibrisoma montanum]RIV21405.1 hypothetical protein DYU11_18540 [Fibrisoma montanum]